MSASVPPSSPPTPAAARSAGRTIAGIFAGLAVSLAAAVFFGFLIGASPAGGLAVTGLTVGGLLVFQFHRWKRATDFQRGLLLGEVFCALVAGACFVMFRNLKIL